MWPRCASQAFAYEQASGADARNGSGGSRRAARVGVVGSIRRAGAACRAAGETAVDGRDAIGLDIDAGRRQMIGGNAGRTEAALCGLRIVLGAVERDARLRRAKQNDEQQIEQYAPDVGVSIHAAEFTPRRRSC